MSYFVAGDTKEFNRRAGEKAQETGVKLCMSPILFDSQHMPHSQHHQEPGGALRTSGVSLLVPDTFGPQQYHILR